MRKIILLAIFITSTLFCFSQDFFRNDFNKKGRYVILTNPTVNNLRTIEYLVAKDLLDLNSKKIQFVGVYHENQKYDFEQSIEHAKKNSRIFMHAVKGKLDKQNLFEENSCSDELTNIFNNSIGIFFFGGADIPPSVYGEENMYSKTNDPIRNYFETTFLFHLLGGSQNNSFTPLLNKKPDYLVTGFCLGLQTMNVATGGTLIQDIPAEVYGKKDPKDILAIGRINLHRNYWQTLESDPSLMNINLHTIQFSENPFFGEVIKMAKGWQPRIYSSHHQAIEKLGKNMEVTAWSPDGKVIEGIVSTKYPNVFAVQFHPEVPALYEDMELKKFHPEDTPMTYYHMLGRSSIKFHEKYWGHISNVLNKLKNRKVKSKQNNRIKD